MTIKPDLIPPCGLYCGVCAIRIAHRENNRKFKERLANVYKGKVTGKGALAGCEALSADDIRCEGCLSDDRFVHCQRCEIRSCCLEKGIEGCHQCDAFPCEHIDHFPMTVGKKVILRAVPYRRKVGTERWVSAEEARYVCPGCGNRLFRGAMRCNRCKTVVDLD
jgi:hypothetical protein